MARKIPTTRENLEKLYQAFDHYYPEGVLYSADGPFSVSDLSWANRQELNEDIKETTGVEIPNDNNNLTTRKAVKQAQLKLEELATQKETEIGKDEALDKDKRDQMEAERAKKEEVVKKINEDVKRKIDESIKKQQDIAQDIKDRKIYAQVKEKEEYKIPEDKQKRIDELKNAAKVDPNKLTQEIEQKVKNQISELPITEDEKNFLSKKIAYDTVNGLANPEAQLGKSKEAAILNHLGKEGNTPDSIKQAALEISFFRNESAVSRKIIEAIDKDLAYSAFGPDINDYDVSFSENQFQGQSFKVDFGQLSQSFQNILGNESRFFENMSSQGQIKAKNFLIGQARGWLDGKIATMAPEISGVYNTAAVQGALDFVGFSKPIAFGETGLGNFVLQIPGATPFLERAGGSLGIDFIGTLGGGVAGGMAASATAATALSVTTTGGLMAGEAFLGGAGVAAAAGAGAAAGSVVPVVGTIVGAVGGFVAATVGKKVIDKIKDNLYKVKDFVIGGAGFVFGFAVGGISGGIVGGLGAFGLSKMFTGGLSAVRASAATGARNVFNIGWAVGATALTGLGGPILSTLLVFPVVVALILFIINSGAYVVPPGTSTGGSIDIICNKNQSTAQTPGSQGSTAANAAVCIVSYLDQFHLNPLLESYLNSSNWKNLASVLPQPALGALESSAHVDFHLQCVGFVAATAGLAYGQAFGQINACSYIKNAPSGYQYVSGTTGMKSGDFFLINGKNGCSSSSPGHIGVVLTVDGALISCADANAIAPGKARTAHGCFALSQITGYLRK